jgi:eukaryotic-like serine/threonine-protein kinase
MNQMGTTGTPAQIGRFKIIKELGRGAQGRVYLAEDPHPARLVAIKVLDLHGSHRSAQAQQLIREAQTIGRLQHPNIIRVYEAHEDAGTAYIVFEYVEGITLTDLIIHRGKLDVSYGARLMSQLLDGMAYAHEHGIVHKNLKPANILIDKKDMPRIMDFGAFALPGLEPDDSGIGTRTSPA